MKDNIDINAGKIIDGHAGITEVATEVCELMLRVASGEHTKAEALGYDDFVMWRPDPVGVNLVRTCL